MEHTSIINRVNRGCLNPQLQLSFGSSVKLFIDSRVRCIKRDVACGAVRVPFKKDFLVGREREQSSELQRVRVIQIVPQEPKGKRGKHVLKVQELWISVTLLGRTLAPRSLKASLKRRVWLLIVIFAVIKVSGGRVL